jgi:hypothetical protein
VEVVVAHLLGEEEVAVEEEYRIHLVVVEEVEEVEELMIRVLVKKNVIGYQNYHH